jgi:hypothetical protein
MTGFPSRHSSAHGGRPRRSSPTRRALLVLAVAAVLALPGGAAATGGAHAAALAGVATNAGIRVPAIGGRSARAAHAVKSEVARVHPATKIKAPMFSPPGRGAAVTVASDRRPVRAAVGTTTSPLATTTTLEATPNPLTYPQLVHLVATVTPAPAPDIDGYLPGIGFNVDGAFHLPAPLDVTGVASVDMTLAPGKTYMLTADFVGNLDFGPSTSNAISEVVVQKPALATEAGNAALQSGAGFAGDAATSAVQAANPSLGVGPTTIVQMTEDGSRYFDHAGNPLFHLSLADEFLFEPPGQDPSPHGPRVLYDTLHGRWISTEVTHDAFVGNGHLYIEISDTNDATGGFWVYRWDFADTVLSSPAIGVSSDKVAIGFGANRLSTGAFLGSSVLVVNYADLIAHLETIHDVQSTPDPTQHLWRPAVGLSAGNLLRAVGSGSATNPAHLLQLVASGTVTGQAAGVTFTLSDLTSGPAAVPDAGNDGSVPGVTSALWSNNHLWFVSTRSCLPTGDPFSEPCVRVTELSTSGTIAVLQDFAINKINSANFGGGIGLAGDGSLIVVYSQRATLPGSPGNFDPISTYATIQAPGDPVNTVRPSQLIDQGTPWCPGGPTCVGSGGGSATYVAVPADPLDTHAVWEGAVTSVAGGWRTWVSRLRTATGAPTGTMTLAGGRTATNSLRLGIGLVPGATATATQVLLSNSPTKTSSGQLASAIQVPIGWRKAWSLADAAAGGSSATGSRTVYVQWGDGRATWSAVQSRSITVDTPLGSDLVPLNPARLLDTRSGNGLSGPFVSHVPRSFQVTGRGGVPAGAVAVTGNLTVTGQTSKGYVFLGPTAPANPTSSTLNVPLGDTRANGVTVKLSSTGMLGAVFVGTASTKTASLIFDVTGYLLADNPNAPVGSTWVPLAPVRALDTRAPIGLAGRFSSRLPRTFCITGCVPVPDDAVAVTGNLTVTGQTTAGFVFIGPSAGTHPTSSTLNFPLKDTRANNVTVRLDANGNLSAVFVGTTSSASTNLIFDVTGYFVRGPWGATFIPLDPQRILDSRSGIGLSGAFVHRTPRSFAAAGHGGVPGTGTLGVTGNLTITQETTNGYAFLGPTATGTPTSSTINVPFGDTRANGADVGLAANGSLGAVWIGTGPTSTAAIIFDVGGYFR